MEQKKQIEEMACKNCIHYEVCMYVNAQAVEYARAENCKLFKNTAGYRNQSETANKIFEEIGKRLTVVKGHPGLYAISEADFAELRTQFVKE